MTPAPFADHRPETLPGAPLGDGGKMNRGASTPAVIGRSLPRLEDPPLLTGRGAFVGDINFPHQLHMRVVRSP
ncbi:MAG: hypothetical protein JO081_06015, partial [Alphaproteobacteria bacterium]|nr:hypothetical protein [Alphaproteobacteria bacterium]